MILFASGRTDIPAFYSKWFINRIHAGFVDVRNPYHRQQVSRYRLDPQSVDCLVFCTKNPEPMIQYLNELDSFGKYFFVTITPYGKEIEPNVPEKSAVINSFINLSEKTGKEKVCWRYDPIFIDSTYTAAFHIRSFRAMCQKLAGYTERCIISFVDLYEKTKKNFPELKEVSEEDQKFIAGAFSSIAREFGITVESCAEKLDLSSAGIKPGACISIETIERATGLIIKEGKIQKLRQYCNCLPSRDIAHYNCCPHLCKYCYANYDSRIVAKNFKLHNPDSSFLIGGPETDDIITEVKQESFRDYQPKLFN